MPVGIASGMKHGRRSGTRTAALRASIFLQRLFAWARFAYIRLLEFGDGDYARNRFLNHVDDRGFNNRSNWRLHRPGSLPRDLFRLGALGLGHDFLWPHLAHGPLSRFASYRLGGLARPAHRCFGFSYGNSLFALSHVSLAYADPRRQDTSISSNIRTRSCYCLNALDPHPDNWLAVDHKPKAHRPRR